MPDGNLYFKGREMEVIDAHGLSPLHYTGNKTKNS